MAKLWPLIPAKVQTAAVRHDPPHSPPHFLQKNTPDTGTNGPRPPGTMESVLAEEIAMGWRDERYLTKREVAEVLRCSISTVERYARVGYAGFPASVRVRKGRALWLAALIQDWLRRRERDGG